MKFLEHLRRAAKALKQSVEAGDADALIRIHAVLPDVPGETVKHADALHVVAREAGFASWPRLKAAVELHGLDRAGQLQALKQALYLGQNARVDQLLRATPDLADGSFALQVALLDLSAVERALRADPKLATRPAGPRGRPLLHLAFSRRFQAVPDRTDDMLAIANLLLAHGASVDDSCPAAPGSDHRLSALYGAIGHAGNMALARWLLEHGANPDDNESLYHATELGHREGLELLLAHGADPKGTNALLRALDFGDPEAVRLLLEAGADPNEGFVPHPSGQPMGTVPALHQAARRLSSDALAELLLDHGADPGLLYQGHSAYALARVFGNRAVADAIARRGGATGLSDVEAQLARAAEQDPAPGDWIDMALLSPELRLLLTRLVWREGALPHMRRLVAMGFDTNATDEMGMTPLHLAGWEGMPEVFAFFLRQQPDMAHVNAYGGTLFSTILHGSENCPQRATRDHIACMRLALEEGVALPRRAPEAAGDPDMAAFLADWAAARPGQVVEGGVV